VQAYLDAFAEHPEMMAAGGPVRPRWEADPPRWLLEHLSGREACGQLALMDRGEDFLLGSDGYFFGVNMAIRYETLDRFGGFRPESFGTLNLGSGEWGLVHELQRAGTPIGYVPSAVVWHHVPPKRLEPAHFERWAWHGTSAEMFERWHRRPRHPGAIWADARRILRTYWRPWLRALVTRRRPDLRAVLVRSEASAGRCEVAYLWRMVTRRDLKAFLDAERFGP
jgi:GT2 family glycosyltransferase